MNSDIFDLSQLPVGCLGTVVEINAAGREKDRLTDMGFAPSLKVKTLFKSPAQNPIAYEVMGAVLALRNEDASKIIVQEDNLL
ncbi:ferrous iron transport protein A [bacterium 210820-DFI.6.37]|nr:ferrous iron transport protein A [bacterium 210820-DFI.6.37]